MPLIAGYFDESHDELENIVYTVAGYMSPGWQASIFEMRWQGLLDKWKMKYFKASELESGFGEFVQYRDDPSNKQAPLSKREKNLIREIKIDFVDLICSEPDLWGYSATVSLRDLHLMKREYPEIANKLPPPYYLCCHLVMIQAGLDLKVSNEKSPSWATAEMRPIFDSHKDYAFHMIESFPLFTHKNPSSSKYMLEPIYEDEQTYLCLQAADCLAFESRKFSSSQHTDPDREPRVAFVRLMEHVRTAYYVNFEAMKLLASVQTEMPDEPLMEPTVNNRDKKTEIAGHPKSRF